MLFPYNFSKLNYYNKFFINFKSCFCFNLHIFIIFKRYLIHLKIIFCFYIIFKLNFHTFTFLLILHKNLEFLKFLTVFFLLKNKI